MDQTPETKTEPKSAAPLFLTAAGILALSAAGLVGLRYDFQRSLATQDAKHAAELTNLKRTITSLESRLTELAAAPAAPAPAPIIDSSITDALHKESEAMKLDLKTVTDRLTLLETKPAPAPLAPRPNKLANAIFRGAPYQTALAAWEAEHPQTPAPTILKANAERGIATEAALRTELLALLAQAPASGGEEPPLVGRINTELSGLVNIRRATPISPLAELKPIAEYAPLTVLDARIQALPAPLQARFSDWRERLRIRTAALAELDQLPAEPAQ